jgi:prolyl-tRNA editing enzyme YbaK/EbsC (Cys-tRNA(Pro) deacylase)
VSDGEGPASVRTTLDYRPALEHLDLLAPPVARALQGWPGAEHVEVVQIDPAISDTASLVAATGQDPADMGNCVVVGGRRDGVERVAACVVLATTRADVNGTVRGRLEVRKASFLPMERAVEATGMEYGAITPIGLPPSWALLVDAAVVLRDAVVVGAGVRAAKLRLPGRLLGGLPGVQVIDGLAR